MQLKNARMCEGTLLRNRYLIGPLIGTGSFGNVHEVSNTHQLDDKI